MASGSNLTSFTTGTLTNLTNAPITVIYQVTPKAAIGSCAGVPFTGKVTVNPKPAIENQTPTAFCGSGNVTLDAGTFTGINSIPANTSYTWSAPINAGLTGISASGTPQSSFSTGTLTNTTNAPITVNYVLTPISGAAGSCVGNTFTVAVTVNPKPAVPNQTPAAVCSPGSFSLTPTNGGLYIIPTGTTYSWPLPVAAGLTGLSGGTAQPSFSTGTLTNTTNSPVTVMYSVTAT